MSGFFGGAAAAASPINYIAGNWYNPIPGTVAAGTALGADTIHLLPFVVSRTISISDLGARITTAAASGNIQLAIYANNAATGRPTGAALAVTIGITTAGTGVVSADITGANVQLTAGIYWMAVNADTNGAAAVLQGLAGAFAWAAYNIGATSLAVTASGAAVAVLHLTVAQVYNTWPDLTAGSFTEANTSAYGLVFFKVGSVP